MRRSVLASFVLLAAVAATPAHASGPLPPTWHCVRDVCVLLGVQVDGTEVTVSASCALPTVRCTYATLTVPPIAANAR